MYIVRVLVFRGPIGRQLLANIGLGVLPKQPKNNQIDTVILLLLFWAAVQVIQQCRTGPPGTVVVDPEVRSSVPRCHYLILHHTAI